MSLSYNLNQKLNEEIINTLDNLLTGHYPLYLVESGVSVFINQNRAKSTKPKNRSYISQSPTATILVKKKAFSTFSANNDLKWMDKTEKMLLRATKALFAYKINQLRAYESLTKLSEFTKNYNEVNLNIFIDALNSAKYLDISNKKKNIELSDLVSLLSASFSDLNYDALKEDVLKILKRNSFATQNYLSTWIVDPDNADDYSTGPGTGVIELCNFSGFSTNTVITMQGASADFTIQDPYRILNIIDDDIELAITEALQGTLGLLNDLAYGAIGTPPLDTKLIVSSAFELAGLGSLDPTIDVDYIRDRLRVFYLGKTIINVGDAVHFYIKGNKFVLNSGKFDSDSFDISADKSYFEIDESILEAEKRLFTNNKIDLETYKKIRTTSDSFNFTHVFGGFVKGVGETTNPQQGSSISVSCVSNMEWLSWSRFMENPTLNDPRGVLEDPLTPYKIQTNSTGDIIISGAPELLDENKELLRSGLLSFNSGIMAGMNASESNIYQGQYSGAGSLYGSRVIQHPSGLIYRWKSGVITATADVKTSTDSESLASKRILQTVYGMLVSDNAVSNLDVANAVSTMVTGQPYNVETFTKLAFEAMNIVKKDGAFNPTSAMSTILDSIRTQNKFYGNFKPFRLITMSQKTLNQLTGDYFGVEDSKLKINQLRAKKNKLKAKIASLQGANSLSDIDLQKKMIIGTLNAELNAIDLAISAEMQIARSSTGVDPAQVFNQAYMNDYSLNNVGNSADYDVNRAMSVVSSQRKIEDVRLNRDSNYLIISDLYDANTEIKLFALNLKRQDFQLFKSSYVSVPDRIAGVTDQTGFEFFCNTQGHLELRPPLWNKTPLSVLNGLYKYQQSTNKKIVPDFLFKLFETRSSSLKLEISASNIKIAILAMLLGRYPDASLIPIPTENNAFAFPVYGEDSLKFFGLKLVSNPKENQFYTSPEAKRLSGGSGITQNNTSASFFIDFDNSFDWGRQGESKKDSIAGNVLDLIGDFSTFFLESKPLFGTGSESIYDFAIEVAEVSTGEVGNNPGLSLYSSKNKFTPNQVEDIRKQFLKMTGIDPIMGFRLANGQSITEKDFVYNIKTDNVGRGEILENLTQKIDIIFKEIEKTISSRNSLVTILKNNLKKQEELERVNTSLLTGFAETTDQELLDQAFGAANRKLRGKEEGKKVTEWFTSTRDKLNSITDLMSGEAFTSTLHDHLIDDDTKNILGPGSGRRFIIGDEEIQTMSFNESPPDFVRVDVFGQSPLIDESLKGAFGGENLLLWAGATDFDLWRQYGYKSGKTVQVPYVNSAEYGAKPLALMHMMMQRVKIFSGNVSVSGNEFYQPGDTVYIPSKGLLFYVTRVSHQFNIGSSFSTTLQLEYGHAPGIYLPTPIDVIGEQYNKQFLKQGDFLNIRNTIGDDNYRVLEPDGCIIFPSFAKISENNLDALLSYRENQVAFYNMITDLATGLLTGSRVLFIRGFVENKVDSEKIKEVEERIEIVKKLFMNPVMLTQTNPTSLGDDLLDTFSSIIRLGTDVGNTKDLMPIVLPNGITAPRISEPQIMTQICYLKKDSDGTTYDIKSKVNCLTNKDLGSYRSMGKIIDIQEIIDQFPKDGPRQSSIFKARSDSENSITIDILALERVVEVGILNLDKFSSDLIKSLNTNSNNISSDDLVGQ
jgi:hypothetical protein